LSNEEKRMIMKILKKRWGSREKGGGGNEIHAPCTCALRWSVTINVKRGKSVKSMPHAPVP
jgi:hypothetical protein